MFDVKNFTHVRRQRLAEALNYVVDDLRCHNRPQLKGFRFVSRGPDTAYLNVPENPKGALCVHLEEGEIQAYVYFHPSRTGKEAWEMSATKDGCDKLCHDPDMDEDRVWANSKHEPYYPPRLGEPSDLYDIALNALGRYVSCSEKYEPMSGECYF
jgi:hypothetical protein